MYVRMRKKRYKRRIAAQSDARLLGSSRGGGKKHTQAPDFCSKERFSRLSDALSSLRLPQGAAAPAYRGWWRIDQFFPVLARR